MWAVLLEALFYGLEIAFGRRLPPDFAVLGWRALVLLILQISGTALIAVAVYAVWIWMQEGQLRSASWLKKPVTITANEAGICGAMAGEPGTIAWSWIYRIIETEAHFVVSMGALNGLIIPKRAFDSPAQAAEFGVLLQRKWAEHRPDAAPIAPAK